MPITPKLLAARAAVRPEPRTCSRELRIDAGDHIAWARGIARGVRADFGFAIGSEEELELEGCALVTLTMLMGRFDESRLPPTGDLFGAFRGFAATWLRSECRREAQRLRNGGLYRTTAGAALTIVPLPTSAEGEEEVTDPISLEEPDHDGGMIPGRVVFRANKRKPATPNAAADPGNTRGRFAAVRAKLKKGPVTRESGT